MKPRFLPLVAFLCLSWRASVFAACPDLNIFYSNEAGSEPDQLAWEDKHRRLLEIFDQCLLSSEYFALLGAAQLNIGLLAKSMESLERALLLDPENGAALIDYAEALLLDGQLFAAIEANAMLIDRDDVPDAIDTYIRRRQRDWSALIRQTSWQLDLLGGYDDNLNGAPDDDLLTLTLSGRPILLTLNEKFQAARGPFLNSRLSARHQRLGPDSQHNWFGQIRGRFSEDTSSDVVQFSGRYTRLLGQRGGSIQWGGGFNHLAFSGQPLFTGTDVLFSFQVGSARRCRYWARGGLQHQTWHEQRRLDGLEVKASLAASCPLEWSSAQRLNMEGSVLHNAELNDNRLGGNRDGWQFVAAWQMAFERGLLSVQFNHTRFLDGRGFSTLFKSDARRVIERSSVLMQYREPIDWLSGETELLINVYHQDQNSNLSLFETEDTSVEVGLSWRF